MDPIAKIYKIAEKAAPSRPPAYIAAHVLKAIEIIGTGLGVGRQQLARELGLGEGTARTLVKRMRDEELLEVSKGGMNLTKKGAELLTNVRRQMLSTELTESGITVGPANHAVLVKGVALRVKSGVEQRDSALMAGAKGATTLVFKDGRFTMPGMEIELSHRLTKELISRLKPDDGDVVIIGTADSPLAAELGAKAAALDLLR